MRILVVDDSKAMRMMVVRTLRQAGFGDATIEEAENGAMGLEKALADPPDLILSDWNMPEMNGIDFLRNLREKGGKTRFGFVTSEGGQDMRDMASEAGALFLITKPFTAEKFKEQLDSVLA